MILLVYAVISPLVCFITFGCFLFIGTLFRHQFVYIYQAKPDSGGKLYISFIRTLIVCILIAEVTIAGLLGLKGGKVAAPMMIPLIVVTVLFSIYLRQEHYRVADYLPSRLCLKADKENEFLDLSFLTDAYLQPEMCDKEVEVAPDVSPEKVRELGFMVVGGDDSASITSAMESGEERSLSCRVTRFENLPTDIMDEQGEEN